MNNEIKIELRKAVLENTFRCTKETYAKLHVGQVVQAITDLKFKNPNPHGRKPYIEAVHGGEKMVIMMFVRNPNDEASTRYMIYAKSLETGKEIHCHVTDVLPCAFAETFTLFRN